MFREAGVPVRVTMRRVTAAPDSCGDPLVVELENSAGYSGGPDALAYAAPFQDSGPRIHIFLDRILRRNRSASFANLLLAHVMVHEITHVLAQSVRHSGEGVMKACWSHEDYQAMRNHALSLTAEDKEYLQQGIARRAMTRDLP